MNWPDDPYEASELFGQCLIEALEHLTLKGSKFLEAQKFENGAVGGPFEPTFASQLAHETAKAVAEGDLAPFEAEKLGGKQLYDTRKVSEAVHGLLQERIEALQKEGTLKMREPDAPRRLLVDVCADQGRRSHMEDKHVVIEDLNSLMGLEGFPEQSYFAVYDGHGGVEAAKFAQAQLHTVVAQQPTFKDDLVASLRTGFLETDKRFLEKADRNALTCGATACSVLIRDKKLVVAWLGDSQAMLCRRENTAVTLMDPHKPQREDEKKRIEDSEGIVVWYGAWRVNGILSVARAIGDRKLKQWVIGQPDVSEFDLDGTEDFLIVGCDGLWDVMEHDKVIEFVNAFRAEHEGKTEGVAQAMATHCIKELSGSDNISIIIAFFPTE